jgi:hypothetical protein
VGNCFVFDSTVLPFHKWATQSSTIWKMIPEKVSSEKGLCESGFWKCDLHIWDNDRNVKILALNVTSTITEDYVISSPMSHWSQKRRFGDDWIHWTMTFRTESHNLKMWWHLSW